MGAKVGCRNWRQQKHVWDLLVIAGFAWGVPAGDWHTRDADDGERK
ncbi:MAG: hypothetical protein QF614_02140 [SAR324 cluster bacterium]|nr:hypothetical protein [SAR324 cluster bacterium]